MLHCNSYVVLQNVVILLTGLIDYVIPDVPSKLLDQLRRETSLTNQIILRAELNRTKGRKLLTPDQVDKIKQQVASYEGTHHSAGERSCESESRL